MSNSIQNLKIYDIIDQLEDLIENSPKPKLGNGATRRTVDIDEVFDLLGDLRTTIPEDIRRANSMMTEAQSTIDSANETARDTVDAANGKADGIVAEAQNKANLVLEKAREEYERLIAEDEIYQEAQKRAQLLAEKAEYNAGAVFENAKTYADDILADLERFLDEYKNLVKVNRSDLGARARSAQPVQQPAQPQRQSVQYAPPAQPQRQNVQYAPPAQPSAPQAAAIYGETPRQGPAPRPAPEPRDSVRNPGRGQRRTVNEDIDDDEDDLAHDDWEEGRKRGLFGRLFGKRRDYDDDDFDDDDDDDFYD